MIEQLSKNELIIMRYLRDEGRTPRKTFLKKKYISYSSLSNTIMRLLLKGLIVKHKKGKTSAFDIELTKQGIQLVESIHG